MIFYTTLSDEDLIALARNGDDQAEDQLAVRYSKLVRACACYHSSKLVPGVHAFTSSLS